MRILLGILLIFGLVGLCAEDNCREGIANTDKNLTIYDTEVFVLIDQTTFFSDDEKQEIMGKIKGFFKEGVLISFYAFSENSKKHRSKFIASLLFDKNITDEEEGDLKRSKYKKLQRCINNKKENNLSNINLIFKNEFRKKNTRVGQSKILKFLNELSMDSIRYSDAKRRVVFLLSDMIENSTSISFYKNNSIKLIDFKKEMSIVKKKNLLGEFDKADVYVYGVGKIDINSKKEDALNDDIESNLKSFWRKYFRASNAKLRSIGSSNIMKISY